MSALRVCVFAVASLPLLLAPRLASAGFSFDDFSVAPFETGTLSGNGSFQQTYFSPFIAPIPGSANSRAVTCRTTSRAAGPGGPYAQVSARMASAGGLATFTGSANWDSDGVNSAGSRSAYAEVNQRISYGAGSGVPQSMDWTTYSAVEFSGSGSWSGSNSGGVLSKREFFFELKSGTATRIWTSTFTSSTLGSFQFDLSTGFQDSGLFDLQQVSEVAFGFLVIGKAGTQEGTSNGSGTYSLSYQMASFTVVPSVGVLPALAFVGTFRRRSSR